MPKKRRVADEIIKGLKSFENAIKNDTPMQVTSYQKMPDGSLKRTVSMKKPSELKKRRK